MSNSPFSDLHISAAVVDMLLCSLPLSVSKMVAFLDVQDGNEVSSVVCILLKHKCIDIKNLGAVEGVANEYVDTLLSAVSPVDDVMKNAEYWYFTAKGQLERRDEDVSRMMLRRLRKAAVVTPTEGGVRVFDSGGGALRINLEEQKSLVEKGKDISGYISSSKWYVELDEERVKVMRKFVDKAKSLPTYVPFGMLTVEEVQKINVSDYEVLDNQRVDWVTLKPKGYCKEPGSELHVNKAIWALRDLKDKRCDIAF